MEMNHQVAVLQPAELMRQSTDIAQICKEIVLKTSLEIQGRKFVRVEGYMAVATAHGCLASSRDVERVDGGYRAIGEVRRMSDSALLASAEGFVGEDEPTWFGGETEVWNKQTRQREKKTLPKRPDYAIRAMCQTRAISRACRSAFAHVVVLMDAGLSTTPAEEVPQGGFGDDHPPSEPKDEGRVTNDKVPGWYWQTANREEANQKLSKSYHGAKVGVKKIKEGWFVVMFGEKPVNGPDPAMSHAEYENAVDAEELPAQLSDFRSVRIHFGKNTGLTLSELSPFQRKWYTEDWMPKREKEAYSNDDAALMNALKEWQAAAGSSVEPRQGTKPTSEVSTQPGSWKDVKIHVAWPLKGHPLGDLDAPMLDQLRAKMEEKAKLGTRNLSATDKKLIAALAMELGERGETTISLTPEADELGKMLDAAKLTREDFMATARHMKWIEADVLSFGQLIESEATNYVDDFETVETCVRDFIAKREGGK